MTNGPKGFFHQAIVDCNKGNIGHPQYELWLNYALSTNQRGRIVVENLLRFTVSLKGKRLLDIGSGYGGTCIAAAQAGACSVGIDIDSKLIELANINRLDHPGIETTFYHMDVLNWDQVKTLGTFDLITCDNVIEHVAVPERLIAHISMLLRRGGCAYVTIPNAYSTNQVRKDCHYGLFGISLLDPWDAAVYLEHALGQSSYDVSVYYRVERYQNLFQKYGLKFLLLNNPLQKKDLGDILQKDVEQLKEEFQQTLESDQVPKSIVTKMGKVFGLYVEQILSDIFYCEQLPEGPNKNCLSWALERDYLHEVWYVAAFKGERIPCRYYGIKLLNNGKRAIKFLVRKSKKLLNATK